MREMKWKWNKLNSQADEMDEKIDYRADVDDNFFDRDQSVVTNKSSRGHHNISISSHRQKIAYIVILLSWLKSGLTFHTSDPPW